ncbi:molybdopterin cofactor-binding domain-containing protein [Aliikangiella sp. G2MR2-5]|uniref:xanthine dehydrogenase family protein molybdopterin-binding subunit n=1 Tax=Aliikangiella sp. G2MR2-5 TaxID=2788943 RepID=UPI0018A93A3E|nr:molybdopterin cofactor-binding domain-containing protein [Aliikangiella sp. G2MR2-5]
MENCDRVIVDRRQFIKLSAYSGASLAIGIQLPGCSSKNDNELSVGAWLAIKSDGSVVFNLSKAELGQNIKTSLAMLVAEELDVNLSQITVKLAQFDEAYGSMSTAGSASIRELWQPIRKSAAIARNLLLQAGAAGLSLKVSQCDTQDGYVVEKDAQNKVSYGSLVSIAATLDIPEKIELKSNREFSVLGKEQASLDLADKVRGGVEYGIDKQIDGLKYAAIKQAPFGAKLKSIQLNVNDEKLKVVKLKKAVAVVADNYWSAQRAIDRASVEWSESKYQGESDGSIRQKYRELLDNPGKSFFSQGEKAAAGQQIISDFEIASQAHVAMEPMNCTVDLNDEGCDIWVSTQNPAGVHAAAKAILETGISKWFNKIASFLGAEDSIRVHPMMVGGAFGRRLQSDFVEQAVIIAASIEGAVKLIWSREEDIQHDFYRPFTAHRLICDYSESGEVVNWQHRVVGPSKGRSAGGASNFPYKHKFLSVEYHLEKTGVPVGSWRGIGNSHNAFIMESVVDQIANAVGQDPIAYRLANLPQDSRAYGVLNRAVSEAKKVAGEQSYLGVALHQGFGSYCAQVAELQKKNETIKLVRVTCVVDCGIAVNPLAIREQIEGGVIFGLSACLGAEINVRNGIVQQSNFHDYPIPTMHDAPIIDVHIVDSEEKPGGIGEVGVPPIAPALANAIFQATGKRFTRLPFESSPF